MVCHAHRMGRKEAYNFLKQFVLEQMRVPEWPHYPMNDLRKMTSPPLPPTWKRNRRVLQLRGVERGSTPSFWFIRNLSLPD